MLFLLQHPELGWQNVQVLHSALKILCDPAYFLGLFCAAVIYAICKHTMLFIVCVLHRINLPAFPHCFLLAFHISTWKVSWRPSLILCLEAGPLWVPFLKTLLCNHCICWFVPLLDCVSQEGNVAGSSKTPIEWVASWNDLPLGVTIFYSVAWWTSLSCYPHMNKMVLAFYHYKIPRTINLQREKVRFCRVW